MGVQLHETHVTFTDRLNPNPILIQGTLQSSAMVVLEAKVEAVAAEKKAKYSNKIKKAKSALGKRKVEEDIVVAAAPIIEAKKSKKDKNYVPKADTSIGGGETKPRKKGIQFSEEVEVKEIEKP